MTTLIHVLDEIGKVETFFLRLTNPVTALAELGGIVAKLGALLHEISDPPPGDPDAIDGYASSLDASALVAGQAHDTLAGVHLSLPTVMVGTAAGTAQQALDALASGLDHESTGLGMAATALRTYAGSLREARRTHATGKKDLEDAKTRLQHIVDGSDDVSILGFDTGIPNPIAVGRDIIAICTDVVTGIKTVTGAYQQALDALQLLQRQASDADGYATLAEAPSVPGFTVLDVAVMSDQWRDADPDHRDLTPDQWAKLAAALQAMDPATRASTDKLLTGAGSSQQRALILSEIAAGGTPAQVAFVAQQIAGMSDSDIVAMLSLGTDSGTPGATWQGQGVIEDPQQSTTCGSTSLLELLVRQDPALALWLTTGKRAPGWDPAYLSHMSAGDWSGSDFSSRFYAAQHSVLTTTDRDLALWPESIGTPPWGASSLASQSATSYDWYLVDDEDPASTHAALTQAAVAANKGTPVPLYVGDAWLPRHVVLITGYSSAGYQIYDPSDGEVTTVPESVMLGQGGSPQTAFGNWSHIDGIVLPK